MSLLSRATKSVGVPSVSSDGTFLTGPLSWLLAARAGSTVSEDGSLALPTIYACVRVLSEDVASLPLLLYRRQADGGKERATDHPLYEVLHSQPNPDMTSMTWRETMMTHLLTWGNSYSEITFDALGNLQLWPIPPARIEVRWEDNRKVFYYLGVNGRRPLRDGTVFHVMGQSQNGLVGLSPIALHRETLGEHMATRDFGQAFYRNMARPATILKHPKTVSEPAQQRLKSQIEALKGSRNAGKTVLLEEGLDFKEIGIPPEDAQYVETRKLQREEAAQLFRMPPHKVGILDHATFTNIEHQAIDYVSGTLRPWLVRIEQAIATQLLDEEDVFAEVLVDGLLRGDALSRAQALQIRWQHGTLTPDEWRALENENALPDGVGKQTYVPVNYRAATAPEAAGEEEVDASGDSAAVSDNVTGFAPAEVAA
jgi:HK97 family phage portal protein